MRNRVEAVRREARGGGGIKEKSGEIFDIRGGGEKRWKKRVGGFEVHIIMTQVNIILFRSSMDKTLWAIFLTI